MERGMSQAELAARAKLHRPNLSNIERGKSDISLRTLRALALALNVRPGLLADGQGPEPMNRFATRAALERVTDAAAHHKKLSNPHEQAIADHLRTLLAPALRAAGIRVALPRRQVRRSQAAWLVLAGHSPAVAKTLLQRVKKKLPLL